jgi:uncharacterized protein YcbX
LLTIGSRHDQDTDVLELDVSGAGTIDGDAAPTGDPFPVKLFDRTVQARLVGGRFAEAVSSWAGFPLHLARVDPPEYAGGIHPVSLISRATVEDLGRRGDADTTPDLRRFRSTIELDGCSAYEEDSWTGRRLAVGETILSVREPIPRCILTTLDPDTGEEDFPTLDVLATYRKRDAQLLLGVYADVERPGRISAGDDVVLLD